jgi:uncharacterized protein (TIGR03435 family)
MKSLLVSALILAAVPLLSQTGQPSKPSFDVISIKPSAPAVQGIRGGGARGNRYTMSNATLRMLLQNGYQRIAPGAPVGQIQIVGAPNWIDTERFDIQATMDCSNGVISREQVQLMVQSMLEDRFQLKAHLETRELPTYNLVVGKDGPKVKASADQSATFPTGNGPQYCGQAPATPPPALPPPPPPPGAGQRGGPLDPNFVMPRGSMMFTMNPTLGMVMRGTAVPIGTMINMLQQQVGRPVIDKTELKGLFDFVLQFSPEGLNPTGLVAGILPPPTANPPSAAATSPTAAEPIPSIFSAIQELGLKLESAKSPVEVLVIDAVQKPTTNEGRYEHHAVIRFAGRASAK